MPFVYRLARGPSACVEGFALPTQGSANCWRYSWSPGRRSPSASVCRGSPLAGGRGSSTRPPVAITINAGMSDLTEILGTIRDRIVQYARKGIGEQNTKAVLIAPVLRALGWDLEDLEEVRLEYRRRPTDSPVDYALFINRVPRLFVEAKALGEDMEDHRWASQILGYAVVAGVRWVVLTNGDEYRIYNSHAEVPVEEKLFRRISVSDGQARPEETIGLLSKESIAQMEELWREDFVDRQVRSAVSDLFAPDPDPALVRLIRRRAPNLAPGQAKNALARLTLRLEAGESLAATPPVGRSSPGRHGKPPPTKAARRIIGAVTPWRTVTVGDLIAAGMVRPPLTLEQRYKGRTLKARLERDGGVTFEGQTYNSLSTAAGMARRSVIGDKPGRKFPQTNGWTFWHVREADGVPAPLDALRQRLFEEHSRRGESEGG